jgi:hypothetical protein
MSDSRTSSDALTAFKDWSNYLLVTTVAAVGWLGSANVDFAHDQLEAPTLWFLGASAVFGIFTLALIPLLSQQLPDDGTSIYNVGIKFRLLKLEMRVYLTQACRPQHLSFVAGIVLFCVGTTRDPSWQVAAGIVGGLLVLAVLSAPQRRPGIGSWYVGLRDPEGKLSAREDAAAGDTAKAAGHEPGT